MINDNIYYYSGFGPCIDIRCLYKIKSSSNILKLLEQQKFISLMFSKLLHNPPLPTNS